MEITIKESAKLTGFSKEWLRSLAKRHVIESRLVGGPHRWYWRIDKESLLAYAREMELLGSLKHTP